MNPLPALLAVLALAAFAPAGKATPDDEGMRLRLAACSACHGADGQGREGSEYWPHLAGKPAGYLAAQLRHFRDGLRSNAQMTWLVQFMDDAWIDTIAHFYAARPPLTAAAEPPAAMAPALEARARALVSDGDPGRDVPACAACHGADLAGLEPGIPALVGLPADYIIAQLGNWRSGIRKAERPDCMAEVARALDPADVRAVATWLSSQSRAGTAPAAAGSFLPPRACGSLPAGDPR